jgi:ATP-dependent helicase HrpB
MPDPLPIDAVLPELVAALRRTNAAVLRAPTGAGKTTRVPPALLAAGIAGDKQILMLEPRRLAARAAARRMAAEDGTPPGERFGHHVRFDRLAGPRCPALAVTPGVLLRYLHDDPYLESAGVVVFDEFHERGLESDLALGMVKLIQQTVRPDLRVVVMSATIEVEPVAGYFGGCPVVASEGRLHPVEIAYEPRDGRQPWQVDAARAVGRLLRRTDGDVLVFLPGMGEIRQVARELEPLAQQLDLLVLPLHGDLPAEQQDAALLPQSKRKVVLSTNVAETSVTVEGVTGVVDLGTARMLVFDPAVGLDRLELLPISRASADQRAGRAGRTRPGVCVRLWGESAHLGRPEKTEPEIRRVDLAGAVLQLLTLGELDVEHFPWLDPPPAATVAQARTLLRRLGAIDDAGVTDLGRTLARLPAHPRLARLLVEGHRLSCPGRAALAAALLAERSPFQRPLGRNRAPGKLHVTSSDVLDVVEVLEAFDRGERVGEELNRTAARFVLRARDQLERSVRQELDPPKPTPGQGWVLESDEGLLRALFAAFPDRLARRRNPGGARGVMVGGRGVKLAPTSGVTASELFLCIDVDAGQAESVVRQASAVERDWLPPDKITTTVEVAFDPATERVTARKRTRFEDLTLDDVPAALPDDEEVTRVVATAAAEQWDRIKPADDSPAGRYLVRIRCLREWIPELTLPAFDESDLRELLTWLAPGAKSFADLRYADWLGGIQGRLTHQQRQAVEREAPERIAVPSGCHLALHYEVGRPPVLAVRIQELFGLADTPRVAGGRVKVLLHLLAPNHRPQQVTDDLASFWANTYPQVRKDLRGRYPKHAWPEDPLAAAPEHRPRRKRD